MRNLLIRGGFLGVSALYLALALQYNCEDFHKYAVGDILPSFLSLLFVCSQYIDKSERSEPYFYEIKYFGDRRKIAYNALGRVFLEISMYWNLFWALSDGMNGFKERFILHAILSVVSYIIFKMMLKRC